MIGGRYRITGVLGEGGMGVVYAAEQQMGSTVRKVAVKTLHSHLSKDPSVLARFHRECGTVAQLEHPNTIKFYDFGSTPDGTLYIAMEFVNGKALSDVVAEGGPMAPERVLKIMKQVCGALDEAHEQGIVHRDLKPENIILTPLAGEPDFVKVLDFGIAARSESSDAKKEQKLTQQGMVLGTPPYMSPEQFTGKALDRRSDIYSLGVVAYEMLAGRLPFDADTPWEWATQHMTAQPAPLEGVAPRGPIPEGLRSAILRALSKNPADRQATAKQFYSELSTGGGITVDEIAGHSPASSATAAMPMIPDFDGAPPPAPPVMAGAYPAPVVAPMPQQGGYAPAAAYAMPAAPPRATGGGGRGLILGLVAVGAILLIATVVVALITLRPSSDGADVTPGPAPSTAGVSVALGPQAQTVVSALGSASPAPEESTPAATADKGPVTTPPGQRKTPVVDGGKPATADAGQGTGPAAGDACAQCVAAARNGNIQGAAAAYNKCADAAQKQRCSNNARAAAPGAARMAAFNGQCAQAKAIVAAATAMGVPAASMSSALQGTKCQ